MVKIRLKRLGYKKNPTYRIVVIDSREKREGRPIEELGHYNPKTKIQGIGGYSGAVDKMVSYIVNMATLQGYKDAGGEKVRYIAVIDKHTTGTCKSLDMQEFWINKENIFTRDDGFGTIKRYKVFGLESGVNLPPTVPPIHPCRSIIEYVKGAR